METLQPLDMFWSAPRGTIGTDDPGLLRIMPGVYSGTEQDPAGWLVLDINPMWYTATPQDLQ